MFCLDSGHFKTMLLMYMLLKEYLKRKETPRVYFLFDFPFTC